jgi:replicative DNA helicase
MANIQSEKLLLSGFIRHPNTFLDYSTYLSEDDFSKKGYRMVYEAIRSLVLDKEAIKLSISKIVAEASSLGYGNAASAIRTALNELTNEDVGVDDIKNQFLEVKRQSYVARIEQEFRDLSEYLQSTGDPLHEIISRVEDGVVSQVQVLDQGERVPTQLGKGARELLEKMSENPGYAGLDIGMPIFESRVGQLKNGSVTFVAATAKAGKSQFALKAAILVAHKLGLPVFIADSELTKQDQQIRLVGMLAQVPYDILENGFWNMKEEDLRDLGMEQDDIDKIREYREKMKSPKLWDVVKNLPIEYFKCSGMSVSEVIPHMRRWLLTKVKPDREATLPQCLVVYDYIKLATVDELRGGKLQEYQVHGLNVASLHDFANKFHIPVLSFGQTNREIDDDVNCIAGAKRIIENVSSVSLFKKKTEEERSMDPNGTHLMRVFVSRFGPGTPGAHINMSSDLSCGDFTEIGLSSVNFAAERERRRQQAREQNRRRFNNDDDED